MTTQTPNLNLTEYDSITDASALFLDFRDHLAGTSASSNMSIIDSFAGSTSASILALQQLQPTIYVSANRVSGNFFSATVASISSYVTNMIINLKIDNNVTGATTLKINSLATITVKKTNYVGNLQDMASNDMIANFNYLFRYDGVYWVMIGAMAMNNISTGIATDSNFLSVANNVISDSGYSTNGISGIPTLTSGSIKVAQLGSGTASGSTVLRGDRTWGSANILGVNSLQAIGFYSSASTSTKQTITGAKSGSEAISNLLIALQKLGLITDSTT